MGGDTASQRFNPKPREGPVNHLLQYPVRTNPRRSEIVVKTVSQGEGTGPTQDGCLRTLPRHFSTDPAAIGICLTRWS